MRYVEPGDTLEAAITAYAQEGATDAFQRPTIYSR